MGEVSKVAMGEVSKVAMGEVSKVSSVDLYRVLTRYTGFPIYLSVHILRRWLVQDSVSLAVLIAAMRNCHAAARHFGARRGRIQGAGIVTER